MPTPRREGGEGRIQMSEDRKQKTDDRKPAAHSLKKLAGGWSEKDASEFEESIKSCEQIDEEMWM
jgi:hypothetical protein